MNIGRFDYQALRRMLEEGRTSSQQVTGTYLRNIDKGAHLNAFIALLAEEAMERAAEVDRKLAAGTAGPLAGMVLGVKDNLAWPGTVTSCGSKMLTGYRTPFAATVLERLAAADAIFIGKTNMDEFAMGSSSEHSAWGPVRHPLQPDRVPGGSSGGSAAAVAAGLCTAALGSDTGGSIRQPASFCGLFGLKPTWGRVSRYGLVAFASSLDQIGPLTRSVRDCADLLQVIAGYDPADATSANQPVPDYHARLGHDLTGLRIGLPREYFQDGVGEEIRTALDRCVDFLRQSGSQIVQLSLPHSDYAIAAYYIIADAEASANLARYDGAHYGRRAPDADSLASMYTRSRAEGFGAEVKRRIMLGTFVLSSGYYDAYYRKAQQVRTLIQQDFSRAFAECDLLLTPVAPTTAFLLGEKAVDPLAMYLSDVYTVSVNMAGLPAMAVPCGVDRSGLPIGAQLIAPPFEEARLLQAGLHLEDHFEPAGLLKEGI